MYEICYNIIKEKGGKLMNVEIKRYSMNLPAEMYDKIEASAKKRGIPMSAVIIFALEKYFQEDTVMPVLENIQQLLEIQKHLESKRSK